MGNSTAQYYSYTPERWKFLFDVKAKKVEALLAEQSSRALSTSEVISDIRKEFPLAQHASEAQVAVWQRLLAALGYDVKTDKALATDLKLLPDWLSAEYPSQSHYLALTSPETLTSLAADIRSSELSSAIQATRDAIGQTGPHRLRVVMALISKAASEGHLLLAIEAMS